jgi:hypothetical protein
MAESIACHARGLRNSQASISSAGRHSKAKLSQHAAGDPWGTQGAGFKIEGNGKHATSNVASHCLRIDQARCGNNNTNANIFS